jgi:hypothetical protein
MLWPDEPQGCTSGWKLASFCETAVWSREGSKARKERRLSPSSTHTQHTYNTHTQHVNNKLHNDMYQLLHKAHNLIANRVSTKPSVYLTPSCVRFSCEQFLIQNNPTLVHLSILHLVDPVPHTISTLFRAQTMRQPSTHAMGIAFAFQMGKRTNAQFHLVPQNPCLRASVVVPRDAPSLDVFTDRLDVRIRPTSLRWFVSLLLRSSEYVEYCSCVLT